MDLSTSSKPLYCGGPVIASLQKLLERARAFVLTVEVVAAVKLPYFVLMCVNVFNSFHRFESVFHQTLSIFINCR